MRENDVAKAVVDVAYHVHARLGPGLLESVYEAVILREIRKWGLQARNQVAVPVEWDGVKLEVGFRADLIVERCVVVELKSVEAVARVHEKPLLTYLKLTGCRFGLMINFGAELIKDGVSRLANDLLEEP